MANKLLTKSAKKTYKILIPESVEEALKRQVDYILKEQYSSLIASNWLDGIVKAIDSLTEFPKRCAVAPENFSVKKNPKIVIRHLIYKKTFRIIFTISGDEVRILSAKHSARFAD